MGLENYIFWSEIGSDYLENRMAHPHQEFPGVPPLHPQAHNKGLLRKGLTKYVCYKEVSLCINVLFLRFYFNWGEKH